MSELINLQQNGVKMGVPNTGVANHDVEEDPVDYPAHTLDHLHPNRHCEKIATP